MPGGLIPGDIERIQEYVGDVSGEFVLQHFSHSEGALASKQIDGNIFVFRIPSIVPAQREDGSCIFLSDDGKCQIHPVSPFGCGYFDTHMQHSEADRRAKFMVEQQFQAHRANDMYAKMCSLLESLGLTAAPLEQRREALVREINKDLEQQRGNQETGNPSNGDSAGVGGESGVETPGGPADDHSRV